MARRVEYIPIITRDKSVRVKLSDVLLIERDRRKLKVVTDKKEYEMYAKINDIADHLDNRFYPCMAGCIINLDQIESMENLVIKFFNGYNTVVGRDSFVRTRQVYNAHIRKTPYKH